MGASLIKGNKGQATTWVGYFEHVLREPCHLERFPEVVDVEPLLLVNRVPPTLGVEVLHDQNLDFAMYGKIKDTQSSLRNNLIQPNHA